MTELFSSKKLEPGVPCGHPGCCNHVSHPCEGCGRVACGLVAEEGDSGIMCAEEESCSVCDEKRVELADWYHLELRDLQKDYSEKMVALAEAHVEGEHDAVV